MDTDMKTKHIAYIQTSNMLYIQTQVNIQGHISYYGHIYKMLNV